MEACPVNSSVPKGIAVALDRSDRGVAPLESFFADKGAGTTFVTYKGGHELARGTWSSEGNGLAAELGP